MERPVTEASGARPWSWHTVGGLQADCRAGLGMALQPLRDDPRPHLCPCVLVPVRTCHCPGWLGRPASAEGQAKRWRPVEAGRGPQFPRRETALHLTPHSLLTLPSRQRHLPPPAPLLSQPASGMLLGFTHIQSINSPCSRGWFTACTSTPTTRPYSHHHGPSLALTPGKPSGLQGPGHLSTPISGP